MFAGRVRRWVIVSGILAALIALYAALGFFAVPRIARSQLQLFVKSHYGRELALGEIRFNPFTLTFEVRDLSLPDADGERLVAFGRLWVDLQAVSIWRMAPSFHEIVLERPYVRAVIRPDGGVNLADLGKGFGTPTPQPQRAQKPFGLFIDRLAIVGGTVTFEDRTRPSPFRTELTPIAFDLRDFSTTAKTDNAYALSAASPEGEQLRWSGTLGLEPFASHGTFEITHLLARTVWTYLRAPLPMNISKGAIDVKGNYEVSTSGGPLGLQLNIQQTLLTDLGLAPKGGSADYIDLERIEVLDTRVDLAKRSVKVGKVRLQRGQIQSWLDAQGRLNLLDFQPQPTPADAAPPPAAAPATWTVAVPDIAAEDLKLWMEDRQVTPAVSLVFDPLKLQVAGFSTGAPADGKLDLSLESGINGDAQLRVTGQVVPKSGVLDAHVELSELDLTSFQPYIAQRTALTLLSGKLSTQLNIQRRADSAITLKGESQVGGLRTVDNELKQDLVNWKELRVAGLQYDSGPAGNRGDAASEGSARQRRHGGASSLQIASIIAREPYARVIIAPDRTLNVAEVLKGAKPKRKAAPADSDSPQPEATGNINSSLSSARAIRTAHRAQTAESAPVAQGSAASAGASSTASAPMRISIGKVRIINGTADYSDFWIQPNFAVGIQQLNGGANGLSSNPATRAALKLDGKVDRYAPFHMAGKVNLLAASVYTDVKLSFKGLELTTMTPYSGHFAGYKIDQGKLSVDLGYKIQNRQLTAEQRFVIDQLQLGERVESPDAVKLPLRLAVALLKDRNGVIDVGLPVSGSLDDPQFRIGPIVWKAVVNLLTKAVTAPFAMLGHLFGGGEEMSHVDFTPGSADLEAGAKENLTKLAKALQERPQLQLDVPMAYSPALDRPSLAARRLHEQLLAQAAASTSKKKPTQRKGASTQAENTETDPEATLANPEQHYRLLLAQFRATAGKDAPLPASALAVEKAKSQKQPPAFDAAIAELETALAGRIEVSDGDLQALGKQRAQAIEDVLLAGGTVDPTRVFVINSPPREDKGDKVRLEMSLK